jgi:transcriptional regulator with XRE-family HTH domain
MNESEVQQMRISKLCEEKKEDLKKLGEKIKSARIKKKITQKELGRKLGYAQPIVNCWENGKREPGANTYIKLIKILDINDNPKTFQETPNEQPN